MIGGLSGGAGGQNLARTGEKAALIIAHPGHELRVFGWAAATRPVTMVLTRGDGPDGASRLDSTSRVLDGLGATPGPVYGRFSDREIYSLILERRIEALLALRDELSDALIASDVSVVACDAEEWYNPSHDVCRYLANAAARHAGRRIGRDIQVFDFPLIGLPDTCPESLRPRALRIELTQDVWQQKLENARHYPELRVEVERALAINGADAFRVECLRPAVDEPEARPSVPFYEVYGERQVQAGRYADVIRYDPHIRAVREALEAIGEV